jgi:DNA-binding MarR family transcriptional regulator
MQVRDALVRVMDLYPRIFFAVHTRHVRDQATRRILSSHQVSILGHLAIDEPTRLSALAAHMGVSISTMSLGVERLVRRGFVRRDRDPGDRRALRLRLSAAGERIKDAQSVLDPERLRRVITRLSAEDRAHTVRGLEILARAAKHEMSEQAPRRPRKGEWV